LGMALFPSEAKPTSERKGRDQARLELAVKRAGSTGN